MLSESTINNLIQPIIDRQEAINTYVLNFIAKRIKEIGELKPSDLYKLERLFKTGSDVKKINAELARLTGLQVTDIKKLIKEVAYLNYLDVKPYYDYRLLPYIPFEKNAQLQKVVKAIANVTANTYINLSNSRATGFLIRDLKYPNRLKFQSIGDTYKSVIDEAVQASQQGIVDYGTAMRRTMKQLVESGVRRLSWDSEYTQRLDTAVRRNILDGVRAINQGVQDEVGKQFGADGKEITVHANSAPDHEPVQGRQFTNEEFDKLQSAEVFQDVTGKVYAPIERAIGTLNCRHFTYSIIIGVSKPVYTEEQLQEFARKNAEGYTLPNGKHLTMYECTQKQREMETEVRKAKDGQIMARQADNLELARYYQARINKVTANYEKFSRACGLDIRKKNMTVSGYHKIST